MNTPDLPPLALIAGPTASGKSGLALDLAGHADVTIINADSAQVYRDLRILSARPDELDMAEAPHRLFGYIDGAEACSAARWAADARAEIARAHEAGRLPVLVGGTGLYIRTLLNGIAPIPEIEPAVRAAVRGMAVDAAHIALRQEDPESAARLAPADTTRVQRALEVVRSTGHPLGYWHQRRTGGIASLMALRAVILVPPRDWLVRRSDARFLGMVESGAIDEVERLLMRRLDPELPVMRAIGVREISAWLHGEMTRGEMVDAGRLATRQYAKRQYTWFRHQAPEEWPRIEDPLTPYLMERLGKQLIG
ncbi:tRNA (adenosine(37)-N6)-dimethylallyltransferase MiaA [Sphingomonas sp. MAH-20]|jgi:tRNA dimethylallyltransferase|uniref:tRNA dimethylallyltransferase n=1 Tax=Sphingomonas horti TaxID=2682842 RepID=A0A6I4J1R1_9SPHN|nr:MULTISPECIES: tRNA (adenosine(37)-N6)-dimethylallyltransferase MiaA [Sphingomonas]MBA2918571.1 tRNA (adenosine(37)-N6)-dimethylallyltransferase MiaA [Sphingomonas sp. CGMCC 1.13658]MVO78602.1 tRNA (adenosine(37)-N6)-dimethylallyltransferase MiaA [Sphingomonas horti]